MGVTQQTWYYTLDPELKLIHAFRNCRGLKVAVKYNYSKEFKIRNNQDAEEMDLLMTTHGYRVCHPCWKRERGLAIKDSRRPRPGFKTEPRP